MLVNITMYTGWSLHFFNVLPWVMPKPRSDLLPNPYSFSVSWLFIISSRNARVWC